ncbi:phage tail protein [Streptomyces cucumeris]|uniref:phage tail protein n=1 Tax=Streptomyces cucumeris TaxID=2962890 RepID=UPI0020C8CB2C|nr:phage tail protein [Streptomyces sp. NEAU-Y11]MCP9205494.1 phage tail protein [Streptomyces sp. NEAU-Y11]
MLPISSAALAALAGAIRRPARAEWSNDGTTWRPAQLVPGSAQIKVDQTADVRYTATAELGGVDIGRDGINDVVTNVRLWQGLQLARREPEWIPAGHYVVSRPARTAAGTITVELAGREDELRRAKFPSSRTLGPASAKELVEQLVGEALPGVPVAWLPGVAPQTTVPQIVSDDRWGVLSAGTDSNGTGTGIAAALAGRIWADARGIVTVGPVPTLADPVVWRIPRGPGGALVSVQEETSAEGLVNVWIVTSDGGDGAPAITAYAWDDDPNSLTYAGPDPINDPLAPQRLGLTGVRLRVDRYASAVITTQAQGTDVAKSRLADSLGVQSSLSFTAACNPALEAGDVVEAEVRPGVWEPHLVDSLGYTLGAPSMQCTTRTTTRRL